MIIFDDIILAFLQSPITSLSEPSTSNAAVNAVRWVDDVLLGSTATMVAVISVAFVGFLMMTGRVNLRRAGTIVMGCFILFGARSIIAGFDSRAENVDGAEFTAAQPPSNLNAPSNDGYDPYAGASLIR
jgi:type IV secretion system protein VirB2